MKEEGRGLSIEVKGRKEGRKGGREEGGTRCTQVINIQYEREFNRLHDFGLHLGVRPPLKPHELNGEVISEARYARRSHVFMYNERKK